MFAHNLIQDFTIVFSRKELSKEKGLTAYLAHMVLVERVSYLVFCEIRLGAGHKGTAVTIKDHLLSFISTQDGGW